MDKWVTAAVRQLVADVLLYDGSMAGGRRQVGLGGVYLLLRRPDHVEPLPEGGVDAAIWQRVEGINATAVGVAANDEVAHLQGMQREFENGRYRRMGLVGGRHTGGDVAMDKEFARLQTEGAFYHHAGVAAGDEQGFWLLTILCQVL